MHMVQIWATSNIVLSYTDLHHTQTVETRLGASWVKFESISVDNFQFFWGFWLVIYFWVSVNLCQWVPDLFLFLGSVGIEGQMLYYVICWTSLSCKYPKHTITVTGTWYVAGLYALILFSLFYLWCMIHSPALSPGAVSRTWAWLGGGAWRGGGGGTFPGTQSLVLAGYYSDWLGINPCSSVFSLHLL